MCSTDQKVRQAIVKGLDRESIGSSDLAGIDWPVQPLNNNILLQNQEGYKDVAAETGITYDVEGAKADLDALGWTAGADGIREKDGKKLEVKFSQLSGVPVSENEALQTQNMLKEIGVKVDIVNVPIAKFQDGSLLSNHEFEIIAFSWIGTPYPFQGISQIYGTGSDSNYSQLSVPQVDANAKALDSETDIGQADRPGQRDGEDHLGERDDPAALPAAGADRGEDQARQLRGLRSEQRAVGERGLREVASHLVQLRRARGVGGASTGPSVVLGRCSWRWVHDYVKSYGDHSDPPAAEPTELADLAERVRRLEQRADSRAGQARSSPPTGGRHLLDPRRARAPRRTAGGGVRRVVGPSTAGRSAGS